MQPIVAITMGDPCGVGPEIIVKALDSPKLAGVSVVVIGDRLPLERAIKLLGSSSVVSPLSEKILTSSHSGPGIIPLLNPSPPLLGPEDIEFGRPSPVACEAVVSWIRRAVELARAGLVDAVCTCPLNKEQLHGNGFPFPGHTEFIRELTGAENVVMMLAGPRLRVALATIHESLAEVPGLITKDLLRMVIRVTMEAMQRDFAMKSPRIAVSGLNPHAGEAGKFGRGEIDVIKPVIEEFESALPDTGGSGGAHAGVSGPWPADTVFHRALSNEFDAVVAMYHDQGLIPVKLVHFNEAVNVSLGLPIIRTSVDHGTAYDIAGTGTADPGSLIEAVSLAAFIAVNRFHARTATGN